MASRRPESPVQHAGATLLAWTLFVGAWLVLGTSGRATSALWLAGLAPLAVCLAVAGAASAFTRAGGPSRGAVMSAALLTLGGLAIAARTGSGPAVFAAAAGWGVLSCAASRRVGAGGDAAFAPGCVPPPRASADPATWPALAAGWTMLPMMAALALQSDWCGGLGLSAGQGSVLHLAAMLAPAAFLRLWPRRRLPHSPLWIAACMSAGVAMLPVFPGVRGWMAMSLMHALAWGIAWSQGPAGLHVGSSPRGERRGGSRWLALSPAAGLLGVGAIVDAFGLDGLIAAHVVLAALSLAGAVAGSALDTRRHAHPEHEETPT